MIRFLLSVAVIAMVSSSILPETPPQSKESSTLAPDARHGRITKLVTTLVSGYHYRKIDIDDALSVSTLAHYLESLDPNRNFFLATDIKSFSSRYANHLDNALQSTDITPAFEIFRVYKARVAERVAKATELVNGNLNFSVDEAYLPDRSEQPWAVNASALDEIWRERIKNDFLVLRLEGKKDDAAIRENLRKRYETTLRYVNQFTADDVCQLFMNAYAASVGPHSAYLSPRNSENLFIHLSLSLEGIGAVLQNENEDTIVRKIIPGGPADKSGELHVDDVITGVGQDRHGEMVDVVGWRLQDVVNLIRGPKGSVVRLEIQPGAAGPDGATKQIRLVRNRIDLADRAAKSSIIEVPLTGDKTLPIGVIELPTFYAQVRKSGKNAYQRGSTRDVRRLIGELKKRPVAGIVLDLRGNSGGSLEEAIDLTGLFLDSGPVVQIKNSSGQLMIKRDTESGMAWSGPLVVLVNRGSASASEILAGAIQDYGRGLVIGETTHGKGTVQHLLDLNDVAKNDMDGLGQLKLTIAQFFRVNGSSTQYRGITPDIKLPGAMDSSDHGERALDNALPWASVSPTKFSAQGSLGKILPTLRTRHKKRAAQEPVFDILRTALDVRQESRDKTHLSLLESQRRAERKAQEEDRKAREEQLRLAMGEEEQSDNTEQEKSEDDNKTPTSLIPRVLLREAANIAADMVEITNYQHRSE